VNHAAPLLNSRLQPHYDDVQYILTHYNAPYLHTGVCPLYSRKASLSAYIMTGCARGVTKGVHYIAFLAGTHQSENFKFLDIVFKLSDSDA
jgi:hypothetical protein